jgi:uncharacterized protein YqeY
MDTRQKLETALKEAMRSGDDMRRQNIRMVMSAVKLIEVEKGPKLDEAAVIAVSRKNSSRARKRTRMHKKQTAPIWRKKPERNCFSGDLSPTAVDTR